MFGSRNAIKSAYDINYHIDRADIIVLPQNVATTAYSVFHPSQEESCGSSWMKQAAVATRVEVKQLYIYS